MKKNKAIKLAKALRSGGYEQGQGTLVTSDDRFCCLGVACNISKQPLEWEHLKEGVWEIGGERMILPEAIQEEYGLYHHTGGRKDGRLLKIGRGHYRSLAQANDYGCTFEEIADYIEKNWEYL